MFRLIFITSQGIRQGPKFRTLVEAKIAARKHAIARHRPVTIQGFDGRKVGEMTWVGENLAWAT